MNDLNVSHTTAKNEIKRRTPWILFGLLAGIVMVLVGRVFEESLSQKIELVFFIPMIVYMSDIIGTETMGLFVRELALRKISLHKLFWREAVVGLSLGLITSIPMGLFSYFWLGDSKLATTIAIAMTANGIIAVLAGMLMPITFYALKKDPALGTDELLTAISDNISMLIYLVVASVILF